MAAGAGFKEFNTGDVLSASDVNGYLMSQTVMVFADSTARAAAITSPQQGMVTFLKGTNATEYYNGSAWVALGGSSSPLTTKGDLYTYSTTNARLGVGSNGQTLVADSTAATGIKWATPSSGSMTLLSTTTCNSGTTTQTVSSISTSYTALRIIVKNVKMASTGASWSFRLNGDSGTNYMYGYVGQYWGGSDAGVNLTTSVPLGIRNSNSTTWSKQGYAVFDIYNYNATGQAQVLWKAINQDGGAGATYTYTSGEAIYNASSAVSSFSLLADTNFSDGTILVYGVN